MRTVPARPLPNPDDDGVFAASVRVLRPHQRVELAFALDVERGGLVGGAPPVGVWGGGSPKGADEPRPARGGVIASGPGSGKAAVVLALARANPVPGGTLVLCPPMCVAGWKRDLQAFGLGEEGESPVIVVGAPDAFYRALCMLRLTRFGRVVFDDFHCYAGSPTFVDRSLEIGAHLRWALSATPSPCALAPFLLDGLLRVRARSRAPPPPPPPPPLDAPFERHCEPALPAFLAAHTVRHDVGPHPLAHAVDRVPMSPHEAEIYGALSRRPGRGASATALRRALELGVPLGPVPSDGLFLSVAPASAGTIPAAHVQCPACLVACGGEVCTSTSCGHAFCRTCARCLLLARCEACAPLPLTPPACPMMQPSPANCARCVPATAPCCPLCSTPIAGMTFRAAPRSTKLAALFAAVRATPADECVLVVVSDAIRARELLDAAGAARVSASAAGSARPAASLKAEATGEMRMLVAHAGQLASQLAGLELQGHASRVFFMTHLPWVERTQAIGRVCRPGQARPVTVTTFVCEGTVDADAI